MCVLIHPSPVAYENAVAKMAEEAVEGMDEPLSAAGHTPLGPTLSSVSAASRREFYLNVDKGPSLTTSTARSLPPACPPPPSSPSRLWLGQPVPTCLQGCPLEPAELGGQCACVSGCSGAAVWPGPAGV